MSKIYRRGFKNNFLHCKVTFKRGPKIHARFKFNAISAVKCY